MDNLIKNKRISILICFYERPTFLPLMVHNLRNQSFINKYPNQVELVIVDDSTEALCLNIDELKSKLSGVINDINYIRLSDKLTIGQKRNVLCKSAKYGILIFMDDDDYYFPSYIEYSVGELCKKRKALVGSNCMLFSYVELDFKKLSISCISPRQIHEATMCFLKSHWEMTGGFNERGNGEGAKLIDGNETKVNAKLDISKLMVCICHPKNTCNKKMFINLGTPAQYEFSDELKEIVKNCIHNPLYESRVRICFKYPTRERPQQFKRTFDLYTDMLSKKHDYHFVVSMDSDDTTMNNDDIKKYLDEKRKTVQIEYYYGTLKNKIDAVNRDMIAPAFNVLVLISDDMIPQLHGYDDFIVQCFRTHYPDYDGMLNFNDGLRKDWPELCTLTIYGNKYYERFGYIYNPEYVSVYCDREQTEVGRLLNKIQDIDRVIIKHEWTSSVFNDDLRRRTESTDVYKVDEETYNRRRTTMFGLLKAGETPPTPQTQAQPQNEHIQTQNTNKSTTALWTIIIVGSNIQRLADKIKSIESEILHNKYNNVVLVQGHYTTDVNNCAFGYLHRLTFTIITPYVTFMFMDENPMTEYYSKIAEAIIETKNSDLILFDQECSLGNSSNRFIIKSDLNNTNETVPPNGPWNESYKRSISNWSIFRTSLWHTLPPNIKDESALLTHITKNIQSYKALNVVLYTYNC